jgi:hypothetical protein
MSFIKIRHPLVATALLVAVMALLAVPMAEGLLQGETPSSGGLRRQLTNEKPEARGCWRRVGDGDWSYDQCPASPPSVKLLTAGKFAILTKSGVTTTGPTSVTGVMGTIPIAATALIGFGLRLFHKNTGLASITLALSVIAIAFVQNPQNNIATAVVGGNKMIIYANLFFFSWLTFLASVYTIGVTFRDNFQFGPKFSQWVLLFTASIVLLATSISIRGDICATSGDGSTCDRTKYAVAVGAIGLVISMIAVIASAFDKMGRMLEIGTTSLATILYFLGVVFLTSASGPASVVGNMYFSVWGGCFVSFYLLIGTLFPDKIGDHRDGEADVSTRNNEEEDHIMANEK